MRAVLMQIGARESDFDRRKGLQAQVLKSVRGFRAGDRLDRDRPRRSRRSSPQRPVVTASPAGVPASTFA